MTIFATLTELKNDYTRKGRVLQKGKITDSTGELEVVWFNQPYLATSLNPGEKLALFGKVDLYGNRRSLIAPEYELFSDSLIHTGRLIPIYPETLGVSSKWLRTLIFKLLKQLPNGLPDTPNHLSWAQALNNIHFPKSLEEVEPARHRMALDELLLMQLTSLIRRKNWSDQKHTTPLLANQTKLEEFISQLPFQLTSSQHQAVQEIIADLQHPVAMNRLLEGDVGSGKTVVAAIAAYVSSLNNSQTLILAPTQILATQHYQTLSQVFQPFGIEVGLITGNTSLKKENSKLKIVVGTHALLSEKLDISNVKLIVIDEQHRFGVYQRSVLMQKGQSPHLLTMTATPIPRTIALTLHGDLNISYLDKPPSGRLPVKTWVVPEAKRDSAYKWIKDQMINDKSQTFIVCPFIEPSESLITVKAATVEFEKLKSVFSPLKLCLLHGRLKAKEKDEILSQFRAKKYDILVTTPVVEVGIDIPNATIMLIEAADRFGLAQLHQLRGRVGRSDKQSYCLLFAENHSSRLKAMEIHHDGRKLAEVDLSLRGPGSLYGTAQHGQVQFKIANYANLILIEMAQKLAADIFPNLEKYSVLLKLVKNDKIDLVQPN